MIEASAAPSNTLAITYCRLKNAQTDVKASVERMYLELADHSEKVWEADAPPLGGFVKLELVPELYTLWRIYGPDKEKQDTFLIRAGTEIGEPTLAYVDQAPAVDEAADDTKAWREAQATPARIFRFDRTVYTPTAIAEIEPTSKYLHVVELSWKGAGRVVWNVIPHPCDHPNMPLRTDSKAPITIANPLDLLAQEKLWACPAPGGAGGLQVHVLGYWDE